MEDYNIWKQKSISRRLEIKELKKRHKELAISRDGWKAKYHHQKKRADQFQHEINLIKKKLNQILMD